MEGDGGSCSMYARSTRPPKSNPPLGGVERWEGGWEVKLVSMSGVRSGWSVNSVSRAAVVRRLTGYPSSSDRPSPLMEASRPSQPELSGSAAPPMLSQPSRCSQQPLLLFRLSLQSTQSKWILQHSGILRGILCLSYDLK